MWFKLRRLGVYKVKKMGMNLLSQGSGGMPQYEDVLAKDIYLFLLYVLFGMLMADADTLSTL